MSFAVIQTGGKQYRVAVGDEIAVEKIKGEYKVGDKVTIERRHEGRWFYYYAWCSIHRRRHS